MSEQKGQVVSPNIYWQISLLASILMLTYGILRQDFSIVIGQTLVYGIYIRNLQLKFAWQKIHWFARIFTLAVPLLYWIYLVCFGGFTVIFSNSDVSLSLMIWGTLAQLVFVSRFFYQWIYSENNSESILPIGFWIISLIGSLMIIVYSISRFDPVLFVTHCLGLFVYTRNIFLHFGKASLVSRLNKSPALNKIVSMISGNTK